MTTKRRHGKDEPFEAWIRARPELDSSLGYTRIDLDIFWRNYRTQEFMVIEKKMYGKTNMSRPQRDIYSLVDFALRTVFPNKYKGFYIVSFSGEGPEDSDSTTIIHWKTKQYITVTEEELSEFLQFNIEVRSDKLII